MTNTVKFQKVHFIDRLYSQFLLDHLMDIACICKAATVKDYSIATFLDYADDSEEYGWTKETLSNVRIRRDNEGFYLDLPSPIKL